MRAEQRDPTLQRRVTANQQWGEPVPEAKPYDIPKQLVWEAYQRVKANRGAAGVDGESLAAFEKCLKGNLYKIWSREWSPSSIRTRTAIDPAEAHSMRLRWRGSGAGRPTGLLIWTFEPFSTV